MHEKDSLKIAIVQRAAVYYDLKASVELALGILDEAHQEGCDLVVFGETWLSGYPAWVDYARDYSRWDDPKTKEVFRLMHSSSVSIGSKEFQSIQEASAKSGLTVCLGFNEIDQPSTGTIYNSLVIISNGRLAVHHRKLMPTYTERLVYGLGDGSGLHACDTPFGRIGAMICWEHWMPLARQTMHNSVEHIHIALWPHVHERLQIASRHYAFEGRCIVVAVGQLLRVSEVQQATGFAFDEGHEEFALKGGSSIIGPDGLYILEPQPRGDIIYHTIEGVSSRAYEERMTLDVSGHYQRPDVFEFGYKK